MNKKKNTQLKTIKPELRELLNEFLLFHEYQDLFKQFAKVLGYHGDDEEKIRQVLFLPNEDGEIIFAIEGMYQAFTEFQLLKQLSDKEPYKSLLKEYPEAIRNIRVVAEKMLTKREITDEDLVLIFNTDTYEEERRRAKKGNDKEIEEGEKGIVTED